MDRTVPPRTKHAALIAVTMWAGAMKKSDFLLILKPIAVFNLLTGCFLHSFSPILQYFYSKFCLFCLINSRANLEKLYPAAPDGAPLGKLITIYIEITLPSLILSKGKPQIIFHRISTKNQNKKFRELEEMNWRKDPANTLIVLEWLPINWKENSVWSNLPSV